MSLPNGLFSRIRDMPYGRTKSFQMFDATKNSREFVQKLQLQVKIPAHNGCVNSICWNDNGKYILSGSDDQKLSIVHGYDYSILAHITTGHRANIFSAKFLPNTGDSNVVSCSGDGIIIYSNVERPDTSMINKFNCHKGTTYEIITVPNDPNTFLSCGEDRTVRWFDVRTKQCCSKEDCKDDILINCRSPVTSLAVNPLAPYQLAVGCADASVRIFDRRMLSTQSTGSCACNGFRALMTCFTVPEFTQSRRITSLCYSSDGQEMLVSYSSDYIYLFDIRDDLDKKPRMLSHRTSNGADSDSGVLFQGRPFMKRLRVRGDWSDTGPNARPEAEARTVEQPESTTSPPVNVVRQMTNILTRMLFDSARNRSRAGAAQSSSGSSHASSHSDADNDVATDSNEDEDAEHGRDGQPVSKKKAPLKSKEPENEAGPSNAVSSVKSNETKQSFKDDDTKKKLDAKDQSKTDSQAISGEGSSVSDKASNNICALDGKFGVSALNSIDKPSTSKAQHDCEIKTVISDTKNDRPSDEQTMPAESSDLDFKDIKESIKLRRKDLIVKHNTEPMVNLHYSGEGVNSGLITMDVASSSTPNERQWLEQSASDLPNLPPSPVQSSPQPSPQVNDSHPGATDENGAPPREPQSGSESETEAAVQTVRATSTTQSGPSSPASPQPEASGGNPDSEIELMMEVDSWDMDSDDETRTHGSQSAQSERRSSFEREVLPDSILSSLEDEIKIRHEELRKDEVHLGNVAQPRVKRKYTGHRNARTMIKESTFWGDNFIMSGSDCGHIFVWDRHTTELVMLMEADHHVVNCLQPHPFDPILASSGIDYDIKLWAPQREEPFFDIEKANEIIKRNEVMLEETKDTITVPASFMFRMLVTLNDYRAGRFRSNRASRNSTGPDSTT